MGSCNCGGKTIKIKKANVTKASVKKGNIKKGPKTAGGFVGISKQAQTVSDMSKQMSAAATKAATKSANQNAKPCKCTQ